MRYCFGTVIVAIFLTLVDVDVVAMPKCAGSRNGDPCDWSVWKTYESISSTELTQKVITAVKCELDIACSDPQDKCCYQTRLNPVYAAMVTNARLLKYDQQLLIREISKNKSVEYLDWLKIALTASGDGTYNSYMLQLAFDDRVSCYIRHSALTVAKVVTKDQAESLVPLFFNENCGIALKYLRKEIEAKLTPFGYKFKTLGNPFDGSLDFEITHLPDGRPFDKSIYIKMPK